MQTYHINRIEMLNIIKSTNGKLFSVVFTKKDGTERHLVGRLGVHNYLKGGQNTTAHLPQYLNIFEVSSKSYKKVNLNTISQIKFKDEVYIVR